MERRLGLPRALEAGESVILSSGATATVRRAYPAGFDGDVELVLDGAQETERASALTLADEEPVQAPCGPGEGDAARAAEPGPTRARRRRMED